MRNKLSQRLPRERSPRCRQKWTNLAQILVLGIVQLVVVLLLLAGCTLRPPTAAPAPTQPSAAQTASSAERPAAVTEIAVTPLPLDGPAARNTAEFSGLAWYADTLILLPQFPRQVSDLPGGALFALSKAELLARIDGQTTAPLQPVPVPINSAALQSAIPGFEGFEALAIHGSQVFLTIEAGPGDLMKSYLVRGTIAPDLSEIRLDTAAPVEVPLDVQITNYSNEAIVIDGERLLLFYESNGAEFNPESRAYAYTFDLQPAGTLDLPALEYRLTDAAAADPQSRFWVSNYFFPGDLKIMPQRDPLAEQYGQGPTHAGASVVERLVELQLPRQPGQAITFSGTPPLQIQLMEGQVARNWEGLVRLDGRGFLLVTDKFPDTILAFLPYAE